MSALSSLRLLKLPFLATLHVWVPLLLMVIFLYNTGEEPSEEEMIVPIITSGFLMERRDEDAASTDESGKKGFQRREKKVRLQGLNLEVTVLVVEEEGEGIGGGGGSKTKNDGDSTSGGVVAPAAAVKNIEKAPGDGTTSATKAEGAESSVGTSGVVANVASSKPAARRRELSDGDSSGGTQAAHRSTRVDSGTASEATKTSSVVSASTDTDTAAPSTIHVATTSTGAEKSPTDTESNTESTPTHHKLRPPYLVKDLSRGVLFRGEELFILEVQMALNEKEGKETEVAAKKEEELLESEAAKLESEGGNEGGNEGSGGSATGGTGGDGSGAGTDAGAVVGSGTSSESGGKDEGLPKTLGDALASPKDGPAKIRMLAENSDSGKKFATPVSETKKDSDKKDPSSGSTVDNKSPSASAATPQAPAAPSFHLIRSSDCTISKLVNQPKLQFTFRCPITPPEVEAAGAAQNKGKSSSSSSSSASVVGSGKGVKSGGVVAGSVAGVAAQRQQRRRLDEDVDDGEHVERGLAALENAGAAGQESSPSKDAAGTAAPPVASPSSIVNSASSSAASTPTTASQPAPQSQSSVSTLSDSVKSLASKASQLGSQIITGIFGSKKKEFIELRWQCEVLELSDGVDVLLQKVVVDRVPEKTTLQAVILWKLFEGTVRSHLRSGEYWSNIEGNKLLDRTRAVAQIVSAAGMGGGGGSWEGAAGGTTAVTTGSSTSDVGGAGEKTSGTESTSSAMNDDAGGKKVRRLEETDQHRLLPESSRSPQRSKKASLSATASTMKKTSSSSNPDTVSLSLSTNTAESNGKSIPAQPSLQAVQTTIEQKQHTTQLLPPLPFNLPGHPVFSDSTWVAIEHPLSMTVSLGGLTVGRLREPEVGNVYRTSLGFFRSEATVRRNFNRYLQAVFPRSIVDRKKVALAGAVGNGNGWGDLVPAPVAAGIVDKKEIKDVGTTPAPVIPVQEPEKPKPAAPAVSPPEDPIIAAATQNKPSLEDTKSIITSSDIAASATGTGTVDKLASGTAAPVAVPASKSTPSTAKSGGILKEKKDTAAEIVDASLPEKEDATKVAEKVAKEEGAKEEGVKEEGVQGAQGVEKGVQTGEKGESGVNKKQDGEKGETVGKIEGGDEEDVGKAGDRVVDSDDVRKKKKTLGNTPKEKPIVKEVVVAPTASKPTKSIPKPNPESTPQKTNPKPKEPKPQPRRLSHPPAVPSPRTRKTVFDTNVFRSGQTPQNLKTLHTPLPTV